MRILGLSCYYHDSAAALIEDGQIIAAAQEERFSRLKGDEKFPHLAIAFCLAQAKITMDDIDAIVFYEKPLLKFERIVETFLNTFPRGIKPFLTSMPIWLKKKINQKKLLKKEFEKYFKYSPKKILFSQHHLSHAASAFYPSPFEKSAILCVDGVGEWSTTSAWIGDGKALKPLWDIQFPHSLGLLFSTFTYYCGFKINSGEYKLMGLAPFGKPLYVDLIKKYFITLNVDGSYWLDTQYFGYLDDLVATNFKFEKIFNQPARNPDEPITDFHKDVAASIQSVLNEAMLNLVRRIKKDTGLDHLCLAGGVALNCVTNGLIAENKIFDHIWVQPAAGDAGGALGAALAYYYIAQNNDRSAIPQDSMQACYLGPSFNSDEIKNCLNKYELKFNHFDEAEEIDRTALYLSQNKVVGWFQGRMEYGPRSLGARSILGSPLNKDMQSIMNLKIKFRESFRPFAPIVKFESYDRYFSLNLKNEYMLFISKVKNWKLMPAITHVDGTARVQTVYKEKNRKLHDLLTRYENQSGHSVLINTSFNVRGQPIVCNPEDAIKCFINTNIDVLVMEGFIVTKEENPEIKINEKWHKQFELD